MLRCCSSGCSRRKTCAMHYTNIAPNVEIFYTLESLDSFGSGTAGGDVTYWCGPSGGYAMYEKIKTLPEIDAFVSFLKTHCMLESDDGLEYVSKNWLENSVQDYIAFLEKKQ